MAKKKTGRRINRSQAIRDYLKTHRRATVTEVIEGLADQGIDVSRGLVSNVKYARPSKKKKVRRKKKKGIRRKKTSRVANTRRKGRRPGRRPISSISANDLIAAKTLVSEVGDIAQARKALDVLERLQ